MEGWIKLYRSIMDEKSTFKRLTAIQRIIAIYLILNANHKDGFWFDNYKNIEKEVKRGQLITSRNKIKEWFGKDSDVTQQKIRTALKKLEKLHFLTIETTNYYTLITIVNYELYQAKEQVSNQVSNQELTNSQPATNQELTNSQPQTRMIKNVKNEKNEKECKEVFEYYCQTFEGFYKRLTLTDKRKAHINARLKEGFTIEQIKQAIVNIRTSSYHCGENDKGMFYATLEFICRSPENLEKWINHMPKKTGNKNTNKALELYQKAKAEETGGENPVW